MLPEVKKILLPTDLSANARHAMDYAFSLAIALGGSITILYVLDELSTSTQEVVKSMVGDTRWGDLKKEKQEKIFGNIREKIQGLCNKIHGSVPDCPLVVEDIIIQSGQTAEQIINLSVKMDCDLVILGSHGQGIL